MDSHPNRSDFFVVMFFYIPKAQDVVSVLVGKDW